MTVIAWDGERMASDRQAEYYCTKLQRTKIKAYSDCLIGCAGEARASEAIRWWLMETSRRIAEFPKLRDDDKPAVLMASKEGLFFYENSPFPIQLDNRFFAIGSGGDAAMAVMQLGFDAEKAVRIACQVATGCGGGIDVFERNWK